MTNEQMIRELRAVAEKYKGMHVFTCETNINLMATDAANRIESLCDEISRQKAEIERLKKEASQAREKLLKKKIPKKPNSKSFTINYPLEIRLEIERAEAVKEFAERLKKEMGDIARMEYGGFTYFCVGYGMIDNLVKEFTEGNPDGEERSEGK